MNSNFERKRRAALRHGGALLALAALPFFAAANEPSAHVHPAQTAIKTVVDFNLETWPQLLRNGPRPAAYVFTTSFCPNCPQAFEALQTYLATSGKKAELAAVLMDVQGPQALAHARHYPGASRLYAFDGFEPAIRQSIDPQWPNVTPFVVLLDRKGSVQRSIGAPDAAMLRRWVR